MRPFLVGILAAALNVAAPAQILNGIFSPVSHSGGLSATLIHAGATSGSSNGSGQLVLTITSTGAGHILTVFADNQQSAATLTSITDSASETYVNDWNSASCAKSQFGTAGCAFWHIISSASGVTTITVTGAAFAQIGIEYAEWGCPGTCSLDLATAAPTAASGPTSWASSSITTTSTDLLVCVAQSANPAAFTVGSSGYTNTTGNINSGQIDIWMEHLLTSAAGAHTCSGSSTTGNYSGVGLVAFKL
jgi:hypothetical protein